MSSLLLLSLSLWKYRYSVPDTHLGLARSVQTTRGSTTTGSRCTSSPPSRETPRLPLLAGLGRYVGVCWSVNSCRYILRLFHVLSVPQRAAAVETGATQVIHLQKMVTRGWWGKKRTGPDRQLVTSAGYGTRSGLRAGIAWKIPLGFFGTSSLPVRRPGVHVFDTVGLLNLVSGK